MKNLTVFINYLIWYSVIVFLPIGGIYTVFPLLGKVLLWASSIYFIYTLIKDHSKDIGDITGIEQDNNQFLKDLNQQFNAQLGEEIELEFYIVKKNREINAFCMITSLISNKFKIIINEPISEWDEKYISSLVGHEIGHAFHRHTARQLAVHYSVNFWFEMVRYAHSKCIEFCQMMDRDYYSQKITPNLFMIILGIIASLLVFTIKWPAELGIHISIAIQRKLSRMYEYEADHVACVLTNPQDFIPVLEQLAHNENDPTWKDKLYATHPDTELRIAKIEKDFPQ